MNEKLQEVAKRYPDLSASDIEGIFAYWDPEEYHFVDHNAVSRHSPGKFDQILSHEDMYERFNSLVKGPEPAEDEKEKMKRHNRQLLELLINEFGWKVDDIRLYPNPENIF